MAFERLRAGLQARVCPGAVLRCGVPGGKGGGRSRVDYKEILSADDFAVFVRLREARK